MLVKTLVAKRIPYQIKKISIPGFRNLDLLKTPYLVAFLLLIVLSRFPLLNSGFGNDQDAWVIADSAFDLRYSFEYYPSRFPGYPLPEFVNVLLIPGGWLATNAFTLLLFTVSVVLFLKILKHYNTKNANLLGFTYAFLPVLWINSSNTMDYIWALTFLVAAWWFILRKNNTLAGIMMGLALASRLTSVVLFPSFIFLVWLENRQASRIALFTLVMGVTTLILYLPLILQFGFQFILNRYIVTGMNLREIVSSLGGTFGFYSLIIGILLFVVSLPRLFRLVVAKDWDTFFLMSGIFSAALFFIRYPFEIEYLIPTVPFVLLLLNKISPSAGMVMFSVALLVHSVITGLTSPSIGGAILKNLNSRNQRIESAYTLMEAVPKQHSVIVVGWWIPTLEYLIHDELCRNSSCEVNFPRVSVRDSERDIQYKFSLSLDELQEFQNQGYEIYYMERERLNNIDRHGYDLAEHQAILLQSGIR